MKKRMSVAALGLRMTAPAAVISILAASVLQLLKFYHLPRPVDGILFEAMLDAVSGPAGWYKYVMMYAMIAPFVWAKERYDYTLSRLRIGEGETLAIWSAVFSGYFLIHWAVQVGVAIWLYHVNAQSNAVLPMDFFVASYRSQYFHTLIPHGEPWGYARNAAMCLSYGTLTATIPWMLRHKRIWIGVVALVILGLYVPRDMAMPWDDILLCLFFPVLVLVLIWAGKQVKQDED